MKMDKFTLEDLKKVLEIVKEQQKTPDTTPKAVGKAEEGRVQEYMGNAYCSIRQYPNAIECYSKHLKIAEELGDHGGVARAHGHLGNAYQNIGQYQKAIECHRKCLGIAQELKDKVIVGIAHGNLGIAYQNIGQYQKVIDCHRKHLEIAEELGDKAGVGRARENLGNGYQNIGQYQKAIECHRKHLEIAEELGDKAGVGRARGNLGNGYRNVGQYQKAIECHRKHLKIAEELGDKAGVGRAHGNLGNGYQNVGQYQNAVECHLKHLEITEELGDKAGVGKARGNLGNAYNSIGQYQKAIECHRKYLEIAEELEDKAGVGRAHANLGNAYANIGQYQKAIEGHQKDLKISEELGDKAGVGRAHANLGNAYANVGQYQNAIECHRKHLEIAEELGDKAQVGIAQANFGNAHSNIGQYQNAIECHRKDLQIAEELGNKAAVGRAHSNLGIAYRNIGQYHKSIECHHKDLNIAEELGDKAEIGKAHANLGNAYCSIGQYQDAIECHRKDFDIAEELGDKAGVGRACGNLGNAYNRIGQYQNAIECHLKDLEIAEQFGDQAAVGKAQGNLGNSHINVGQYQKAIECHRKDLEIAEELGDKAGVARAHGNLGNAYNDIGQYQKAIECHCKDLEIAEELGDKAGLGGACGNLGIAYRNIGQFQKAIESHRKDSGIAEELGDKAGVGRAQANLGSVYHKIGEYQNAIECHRKYLEIAEEQGDKAGVGRAHANLGSAYHYIGQYQEAIVFVRRSLEIAEEIGDIRGKVVYQNNLGIFHRKDDDCLASSFFAQSLLSFHSIRRYGIDEDEMNTSLSNLFHCTHRSLFLSLLNLKKVKAALLISDAGKAKALFDLTRKCVDVVLDSALEENFTIPIQAISDDPSSKANEEFLYHVLSMVLNLTVQDGSIISYAFDDRDNLHAWVVSKKGVFHKEWKTVNGMSTKTYLKTINVATRDSLVQNMPKNISFLPNACSNTFDTEIKYKCTEFALIAGEDNRENNYTRDLDERVENLMRSNNSREKPNCDPNFLDVKSVKERYSLDSSSDNQSGIKDFAARNCKENDKDENRCLGCYTLEMPNAVQSRSRKEYNYRGDPSKQDTNMDILFKKQYSLFISPIEEYLVGSKILIVPEGSLFKVLFCALLNSKNEHLCEKYSLQFTPALHVLNACISKPLPKVGPAFFVGNPEVGEVVFNGQVGSQVPLPDAAVEAKECSLIFNAEALLEKNATKENVLSGMKDASIIHIAAHGHMDEADIFLAPNKGAPKPPSEDHYLLTAKDVTKCTLVARLVVLSCCHSGRGEISAEGVVGIARSFLGAGARSVVVTLCEIPDGATKVLMKEFYDNILQGLSVCVALQRSIIELKKTFLIGAWAPFQIVGEDVVLSNDEINEIRRLSSIR